MAGEAAGAGFGTVDRAVRPTGGDGARPETDADAVAHSRAGVATTDVRREVVLAAGVDAVAGAALLLAAAASDGGDVLRALVLGVATVWLVARARLGVVPLAWAGLTVVLLAGLVPGLLDAAAMPVVAALVGLGALTRAAALLPAAGVAGLFAGHREDLSGVLVPAAVTGGVGVLLAVALAGAVDVGDDRLRALASYAAAAGAVLALAEILAHHRAGAGAPATARALAAAGVSVVVLLLVLGSAEPGSRTAETVDGTVTAVLLAAGTTAAGLLVATALATPRPLVVPVDEAGDGPRFTAPIVAGLTVAAVAVRLVAPRVFWLDEAAVVDATQGSFGSALDAGRTADAHPPLPAALVWVARQLAGDADTIVRLPALAAGVLLVPVLYATGTRLWDRRAGLVAAVVGAVGPGVLWLSSAARPGALAALLATLALLTLLRALDEGRPADWVLFGLAGVALIWSHQLGVVHVAVLQVAAYVRLRSPAGASAGVSAAPGDDGVAPGGVAADGTAPDGGTPDPAVRPAPAGGGVLSTTSGRAWAASVALTAAALVAVLVHRGGFGPPDLVPPLEYATVGAPGAGQSVFGLAATAVTALVGFHPAAVTGRLLALWPLSMLGIFFLTVRSWSWRAGLLAALAAAPFVALLAAQVAGAPRNPPFALEWVATAVPMLALALGRVVASRGSWSRARAGAAVVAAVLAVATVDQVTRVDTTARFDVTAAVEEAAEDAGDDGTVVYAPAAVGDLVRHEVPDGGAVARVDRTDPATLDGDGPVVVVGAFGFARDQATEDATLALVEALSSRRELVAEHEHGETKVWTFA